MRSEKDLEHRSTQIQDQHAIHDQKEDVPSNRSGNRSFQDVLAANVSRRDLMRGGIAAAAVGFLAPKASIAMEAADSLAGAVKRAVGGSLVNFAPVTIAQYAAQSDGGKVPVISDDYQYQVLIPWGTPIQPGGPTYNGDPATRPTSAEQEVQVGIGHDGMWFFADEDSSNTGGMLAVNHEFGTNPHLLGKPAPESLEDVRLSQAGHGVSVVRIEKGADGLWDVAASNNSRRITVNTPVEFSGPVAGSELLENAAGNEPLGTVNNCGSGPTPWGTYLTCEENFNGYFGWTDANYEPNESQARYGFDSDGFGYGWYNFDERFDLSNPDYANESNRFGWIVEIDPRDGTKKPVKRTALGRFKHEAIAIRVGRSGRIACYMGDDQRFDYCYKFVSALPYEEALALGRSPLDEGILFVARFDDDGTGRWIELSRRDLRLRRAFATDAELLVNTRLAADIVGATPMDRPEWTSIGKSGEVFWTLTNNSQREVADAANPEAPNNDGHIIRTVERGVRGRRFSWDIYLLASSTRETEGVFTDPDAAYADPFGRLFIGTDGGQPDGLQDQLTVLDVTADSPSPQRLFVGVNSDEITGWATTPDYKTAWTNMQHPGDGDPAATNFPAATDGFTVPRDCTIVITKKDGGIIGS
ncbi:MAG: PhoX family phosphatase [Pseudomonadota bacterium]